MKILLLTFLCVLSTLLTVAQNKTLGVGTPTPNPNAALHVESPTNNQGFIMPRLTTVQRTGMATLLTTADNGLMLYDTDLKTIYIWDGATWKSTAQVAGGSKLSYPYKDSVTTTLTGNDVFALKYNNAASKRVLRIESLSTTNGSSAVSVQQNGTGIGIFSRVDNPAAGTSAIYGTTNSNLGGALAPVGVYGESTGTGSLAGSFRVSNAANAFPAFYAETNGTGNVLNLNQINAGNTAAVVNIANAGTGNAIQTTGKIAAGQFIGDGSLLTGLPGGGLTLPFAATNITAVNGTTLLDIKTNSTNPADGVGVANFENLNVSTTSNVVTIANAGTGSTLVVNNTGTLGTGIISSLSNSANPQPAIRGTTSGTGRAGQFFINNTASTAQSVFGSTNGTGTGVYGENTGTGNGFAGLFQNTNASNIFPAIQANTVGTGPGVRVLQNATSLGSGMDVNLQNTTGTALGFSVNQQGLGGAANFTINNAVSTAAGITGSTTGTGAAVQGITSTGFSSVYGRRDGTTNGFGGLFEVTNTANTFQAIKSTTVGTGGAARFETNNAAATNPNLTSLTNASGGAIRATSTGTGYGGWFEITNASNSASALQATTNGTGSGLVVNHTGPSGNIAVFQNNDINVASINKTGQFIGDGSLLTNLPTGLTLPYSSSDASAASFFITNTNALNGSAGSFSSGNVNNNAPVVAISNNGSGFGLYSSTINPANNSYAIFGENNGNGVGGGFRINNPTNNFSALQAYTNGTGQALDLQILNPLNTNAALQITHTGTGNAITATGKIQATSFQGDGSLLTNVIPSGIIMPFAGTSSPSGYLLCDGSVVSRTTFANLFAAIGTSWGVGDGSTTFNLPDFRGRFMRGVDGGAGNDPDAGSRVALNGGAIGDNVGSYQDDQYLSHTHNVPSGGYSNSIPPGDTFVAGLQAWNGGQTTTAAGGNETRPKNAYVNYIIKL